MRRLILAAALWPLMNVAAPVRGVWAACPATTADCKTPATGVGDLAAVNYGIRADGATTDDAAFRAAINDCASKGTILRFPPGRVMFTGAGATTALIQNCTIKGVGFAASGGTAGQPGNGTTFVMTSTTVQPFQLASNWKIDGISFEYPNADGTIAYPPLFTSGEGGVSAANFEIASVLVKNATTVWQQIPGGGGLGTGYVHDSSFYSTRDAFQWHTIGNSIHFNNIDFTPGGWWGTTNFSPASITAVNNSIAANNTIMHVTAGGGLNLTWTNIISFAWGSAFRVDSGGGVGLSQFTMSFDGVGTIIDTSAGGSWASNTVNFMGNCATLVISNGSQSRTGKKPCFNFGPTGTFDASQLKFAGIQGDFIDTAGTSLLIRDWSANGFGQVNDGGDYYAINVTGQGSGISIEASNGVIQGIVSSTHVHGVKTGTNAETVLKLRQLDFLYLQDSINIEAPYILGDISGNTSENVGANPEVIIAPNPSQLYGISWGHNQFVHPPLAAATACGGSPTTPTGALVGSFVVGNAPALSCVLTIPFVTATRVVSAWAANGAALTINVTSATSVTIARADGADMHNMTIYYDWRGEL